MSRVLLLFVAALSLLLPNHTAGAHEKQVLEVRNSIQAIDPADEVARWLASGALSVALLTMVVIALRRTVR